MALVTLDSITKALDTVTRKFQQQERLIYDLEAPKRELAALAAERQRLADELEQFNTHIAQRRADLSGHDEWLSDWAPFEAQLPGVIKLLEALEDGKLLSTSIGFTALDINRLKVGLGATLEQIQFRRDRAAEIRAELKKLGIKEA